MRPVIALVGRPNVGKSTLFNRLTRSRSAIVADFPGLTRDRQYGEGLVGDRPYIVIDTGGISGNEEGIDFAMASQSLLAIEEATAVLFLVDAREGLTPIDTRIHDYLRKTNKLTYLVVNKVDGLDPDQAVTEFYATGVAETFPITATQGRGVTTMMEEVLGRLPAVAEPGPGDQAPLATGIKIAVAGTPNVGKSTLINRMLGEERVVVFDQAGTTRDSIYVPFERHGQHYTLIDTALHQVIHQPGVIQQFGNTVENLEKLKGLYLLSYAELRAVAPGTLTAWKKILLSELYERTLKYLENPKSLEQQPRATRVGVFKALHRELPVNDIEEHLRQMPKDYLMTASSEEVALHIRLIRSFKDKLFILHHQFREEGNYHNLTLCCPTGSEAFKKPEHSWCAFLYQTGWNGDCLDTSRRRHQQHS